MVSKKVLFAASAGIGGAVSGVLAHLLGFLDSPFSRWFFTGAIDATLIGIFLVYTRYHSRYKNLQVVR